MMDTRKSLTDAEKAFLAANKAADEMIKNNQSVLAALVSLRQYSAAFGPSDGAMAKALTSLIKLAEAIQAKYPNGPDWMQRNIVYPNDPAKQREEDCKGLNFTVDGEKLEAYLASISSLANVSILFDEVNDKDSKNKKDKRPASMTEAFAETLRQVARKDRKQKNPDKRQLPVNFNLQAALQIVPQATQALTRYKMPLDVMVGQGNKLEGEQKKVFENAAGEAGVVNALARVSAFTDSKNAQLSHGMGKVDLERDLATQTRAKRNPSVIEREIVEAAIVAQEAASMIEPDKIVVDIDANIQAGLKRDEEENRSEESGFSDTNSSDSELTELSDSETSEIQEGVEAFDEAGDESDFTADDIVRVLNAHQESTEPKVTEEAKKQVDSKDMAEDKSPAVKVDAQPKAKARDVVAPTVSANTKKMREARLEKMAEAKKQKAIQPEATSSAVDPKPMADKPPYTRERTPSLLAPQVLDKIVDKLAASGWEKVDASRHGAKTAPVEMTKGKDAFTIDVGKFSTNSTNLETFKAILTAMKGAHPDRIPRIQTNSNENAQLWEAAYKEIYGKDAPKPAVAIVVKPVTPAPEKPKVAAAEEDTPRVGPR